MRKVVALWGVITAISIFSIASIPTFEVDSNPLKWEKITRKQPNIVGTELIVTTHELVRNYEPIKPMYIPREFTYEDAQMLMRIAEAEAGGEGVNGMALVMAVVLNRVNDSDYPDSIEGVIFQKNQFQPIADGRYYEVEISTNAHLALAEIESGKPFDEQIIGFEITSNGNTLKRYFDYAYTVGGHDFYIKKGAKK